MGFRFQKRIKLMPGVTLNLSKSGVSTSIGTTGARYTVGNGKRRATVGLPGTGLSYTQVQSTRTKKQPPAPPTEQFQSEEDGTDRALTTLLKTAMWCIGILVVVLWIAK